MAYLYNKHWKKAELLSLIGDTSQIGGVQSFTYNSGKADGVKGLKVDTGSGFTMTVLPGRGMDIPEASFKGNSICFQSGTGITHPAYYEETEDRWLRSFFGGLLTTCGITNSGAPSVDGDRSFGLHGRISNSAAENVCVDQSWDNDEYNIRLKGVMRESCAEQEHLTLTRTIETHLGRNGFTLTDYIENHRYKKEPLMMLYHFNFGFPLLSPTSRILGPILRTKFRDDNLGTDSKIEDFFKFPAPQENFGEQVFFHDLASDLNGNTFISLYNTEFDGNSPLGIVLRFNKNELPFLTQWRMPEKGFYVVGLEPGTTIPLGRGLLQKKGELPYINGESGYLIKIDFEIIDSMEKIEQLQIEADNLINTHRNTITE